MKHKMYLIKNSLCFVWIFLMSACSIVATEFPFDKKIIERDLLPEMVFIPGGLVQVGTNDKPEYSRYYCLPKKETRLNAFDISKTVIPMRLFKQFLAETSYSYYTGNLEDMGPVEKYLVSDMSPAIFMNWYEAILFCNWLSRKDKLEPVYMLDEQAVRRSGEGDHFSTRVVWNKKANGYRLPTIAEWDYAILSEGTLVDEMKKNLWKGLIVLGKDSRYDRINTIEEGGFKNRFGVLAYFWRC